MLDGVGRPDSHLVVGFIRVERHPRQVTERPLMVMRLETQIPLHKHRHPARRVPRERPQLRNVLRQQRELAPGICGS